MSYLQNLYNNKKAFAIRFRTELPVRGNHTNNFAEAQFLVLKDLIPQRIKEYNVVGLIDKLTMDLEDRYISKLPSIPDGSYHGVYKHWSMGKGKDGSACFKVPDKRDLDAYLSTVENFGNNVFKVGSSSGSQRSVVFFVLTHHSNKSLWWDENAITSVGSNFPIFAHGLISNYLDRGNTAGGRGAGFPGSSLFAEKIQHGNITCIL